MRLSIIIMLLLFSAKADILKDLTSNHLYKSGDMGIQFRFSNKRVKQPLYAITPPQIQAGCGGFSITGLQYQFMDLEEMGNMIKQAATSYAYGIVAGMINSVPSLFQSVDEVGEFAQKWQDKLSKSCELGMKLGGKWGNNMMDNISSLGDKQKATDALDNDKDKAKTMQDLLKECQEANKASNANEQDCSQYAAGVLSGYAKSYYRSTSSTSLSAFSFEHIAMQKYTTSFGEADKTNTSKGLLEIPLADMLKALETKDKTLATMVKANLLFFGDYAMSASAYNALLELYTVDGANKYQYKTTDVGVTMVNTTKESANDLPQFKGERIKPLITGELLAHVFVNGFSALEVNGNLQDITYDGKPICEKVSKEVACKINNYIYTITPYIISGKPSKSANQAKFHIQYLYAMVNSIDSVNGNNKGELKVKWEGYYHIFRAYMDKLIKYKVDSSKFAKPTNVLLFGGDELVDMVTGTIASLYEVQPDLNVSATPEIRVRAKYYNPTHNLMDKGLKEDFINQMAYILSYKIAQKVYEMMKNVAKPNGSSNKIYYEGANDGRKEGVIGMKEMIKHIHSFINDKLSRATSIKENEEIIREAMKNIMRDKREADKN